MALTSDRPSLATGLLYLLIGAGFALWAWHAYPLGTPSRMGPGFFPFWLGLLLALTGLFILFQQLRSSEQDHFGRLHWRPLLWIMAAIALFILSLDRLGLIIAVMLLVGVASQARQGAQLHSVLLLAAFAALFSALIFVKGLGLLLPLWPGMGE